MAEEQRCQEGHRLCANNCGFFGSPATLDLCSKCYRGLRLKEEQASSAKIAVEKSLLSPTAASASSSTAVSVTSPEAPVSVAVRSPPTLSEAVNAPQPQPLSANRCAGCRRKVGLTGFKCRCGSTFCGSHRYPEQHECTFNFKAVGREAIARANPVVKAAKLDKI